MIAAKTRLDGVVVLTPPRHYDARGRFTTTWSRAAMAKLGFDIDFVQDNCSLSSQSGTVRGLHFQAPPNAQDKLIRCGRGMLFDVAVDIRKGSPTWGQWTGIELSPQNGLQLLVPKGFLHGFITRAPDTEIIYRCSDDYAPESEGSLRFDDPDIGVDWGIDPGDAILSDRDRSAGSLGEFDSPFVFEGGGI